MSAHQRDDLLTRFPLLKAAFKSRAFQPILMLFTLAVFVLAILTGFFGTPVGSRNFSIIFVWIVWWALLIIILVPFLGRFWCTVCPIPGPGEWLQRRAIVRRAAGPLRTRNLRWPRRFKNMWLQNFGFLTVALFSAIILTRPVVTAWVLLGFVVAGIALSALYRNRVFCRYVCPVGGFIGLYSMMAPVELRVRDRQVCQTHTTKDCIVGNEQGHGCPWMVYPGNLTRNVYCGLCTECIKTCTQNNIVISVRPVGADLFEAKARKLDEAYKAFIMLGCALLYSGVLLGPWGWLKGWANMDTLWHWVGYAAGFLLLNLAVLPGIFWLATAVSHWIAGRSGSVKRLFVDYAYTLVPLGLAAWIAFSLGFVFVNGSYAVRVLSDPFGWGWNLFGTGGVPWMPLWPALIAFLQVGALTAGLLFAVNSAYRIARQQGLPSRLAFVSMLPVVGFLSLTTLGFLGLYLG